MLAEPLYPLHARYFAAGDSYVALPFIRNMFQKFINNFFLTGSDILPYIILANKDFTVPNFTINK